MVRGGRLGRLSRADVKCAEGVVVNTAEFGEVCWRCVTYRGNARLEDGGCALIWGQSVRVSKSCACGVVL